MAKAPNITVKLEASDELIEASKGLYQELSNKNFARDKHEAYLTCFLNIGTIDKFLTAFEKNAVQHRLHPT